MEDQVPQPMETSSTTSGEMIKFNVNFKKQNFEIEADSNSTLSELRQKVSALSGVAPGLQKLMYKGMLKDDSKTLKELNLINGAKVMLVGSTIGDVMATAAQTPIQTDTKIEEEPKESLSDLTQHKKIIDKGVPEGAEPGKTGKHEALPTVPLSNIYNNIGNKVRLTFKVWSQELWIQSNTSTQKIPFGTIRSVNSEPIKGHEEYHLMSLQLGNSDKNKYYLYWVPCQYTRAIKNTIMSSNNAIFPSGDTIIMCSLAFVVSRNSVDCNVSPNASFNIENTSG